MPQIIMSSRICWQTIGQHVHDSEEVGFAFDMILQHVMYGYSKVTLNRQNEPASLIS